MWHLYRLSSRPLTCVLPILVRQRPSIPVPTLTPQRLFSLPLTSKTKKSAPEPLPQPPVNPRHPPDYVPPRSVIDANTQQPIPSQSNIFARFRHAYVKYGKILLAVHFVSSFAWFTGLLVLHFNGFDLGMKQKQNKMVF